MTPDNVVVLRRFDPKKDDVQEVKLFGTPASEWVIAVHTWESGWEELVFDSLHAARAFAVKHGAIFENALKPTRRN